jgi:hypothetical protein
MSYTVNSKVHLVSKHQEFSSVQQETPKKIHNFYKVIKKEIFNVHIFTHHIIVLKAATSSTAHVLPHAGTITAEASSSVITLQYMNPNSFIHQFTVLPKKVPT